MDPLLEELSEKKLSFKRNVVSLATELRDVRALVARETKSRQAAESKAQSLQGQLQSLNSHFLQQLDDRVTPLADQVAHLQTLLQGRDQDENKEDMSRLRDEIRILSAHWIHKTKDLHSQLDKQRRTDQELKKKILKLDFCLQESRSHIRKLQRMGDKRDKALKELRNQITFYHCAGDEDKNNSNSNFWESSGFKFIVSISMLALIILAKR